MASSIDPQLGTATVYVLANDEQPVAVNDTYYTLENQEL